MGIGIGDVTTVFAILAALGIVFPGLLLAWSLLVPGTVEAAHERVRRTPGKSLVVGAMVLALAGGMIAVLIRAAGPFQFLGYAGLFLLMAFASIGCAGIASAMGERLRGQGIQATSAGALLRGAVALEFAVMFPLVGWFILLPIVLVLSLGAACFALVRWSPKMSNLSRPTLSTTAQAMGELH